MTHLKFKESFFQASPHLVEMEVAVLTKKKAESVKDKILVQIDADAFLEIRPKCPDKWQAFCDHLDKTGQLDPILHDEEGYVLDGFLAWFYLLTKKVAAKNILTKVVKHLKTDSEKITWIRSRKLARANLTEPQRTEMVMAEIQAHPERGNNFQAVLLGVDHHTVGKYRQELEALGPKNGGIKWHPKLIGADGKQYANPGKKPVPESKRKESITNAFSEAKKYEKMKHKGMSIPQIADKEGKSEKDVMDTVAILDLTQEKQEQIKQGKLDAKKAVNAQDRLMTQAVHELPNHSFLPKHIHPDSYLFISSLLSISDFFKYIADMDLTAYPPELRNSITKMTANFTKDCARVEKAWDQQRKEWEAKEEKARLQKAIDEAGEKEAAAKKGKPKVNKEMAKGKVRNKVKLVLMPDTELLPDDQKKAAS